MRTRALRHAHAHTQTHICTHAHTHIVTFVECFVSQVKEGDVVLALKSSGVHSNGFSLVRKVLEVSGTKLTDPAPWGAGGKSIGEVSVGRLLLALQLQLCFLSG